MTLSGRSGTAVLVALVISVCLNVFVAGLIAGRATGVVPPPDRASGGGLERFMATVPAEARPVIRRALRENRRDLQGMVADVRAARQEAAAIVGREPFDETAFEVAMDSVRARSEALQAAVHGVIAEALTDLPPDVRAEMAERWGGGQ